VKPRLAALCLTLAAALPLAAPPAIAAPAQRDWSKVTTRAPNGAFVLGNPAAPVKLVEYLSLTCSHCAHFTHEALEPLKADYIRSGKVSLEIRHALRDPFDLAASLLARCTGPAGYFPASEKLFARQSEWLQKAQSWSEQAGTRKDQPIGPQLIAAAEGAGLMATLQPGLTPAKAKACLADPAQQKLLTAMADEAWRTRKIGGTPFFLINGVAQEGVNDWAGLQPRLRAALR
jgi:protein-disulfide isomerase